LATPVFSRLLPPSVFADSRIYESWVYLLAPIVSLSLYQSIARAKFDYEGNLPSFLSNILTLIAILAAGVLFAGMLVGNLVKKILGFNGPLLILMLLYSLAYNGLQCIQLYERQLMHYRSNIILTMLAVIPGVLTSVLCIWINKDSTSLSHLLNIRIVSFFLPTTIIGFAAIGIAWRRGGSFFDLAQWRYGIRFSAPMMATTVSSQVFFQSAIIIVRRVIGVEEAAIVAIAMTVGYIMDILVHAVDNAWRPWLYEQISRGGFVFVRRTWKVLLLGVCVIVWCLTMITPELVLVLGGARFKAATVLISPILCGSLANFLLIEYTALEQYYKKTRISGFAGIISAVINIALNFLFVKIFGYTAVVYTTYVSYLIACGIHYMMIRGFEKSNLMQTGFSIIIIVGTFALCMLSTILFVFSLALRTVLVLAVLASVGFGMRKQLFGILNTVVHKT